MEIRLRPIVLIALATLATLALGGWVWWVTTPPDIAVAPLDPPDVLEVTPVTRAVRPPPPASDFAGDQACAKCHGAIAQKFAASAMGRSVAQLDDRWTTTHGPAPAEFHPGGKCVYRVEPVSTGVQHHEQMKDESGQLIYDQSVPIAFSLGSGTRGMSFLTNREGILSVSSITWYANGSRYDLAPGYIPDDPRGFRRRVIDECLACHAGRVASLSGHSGKYAADPFPQLSIGCENCHGPGQQHIAVQEGSLPASHDTIVNPVKLPPPERESVCNQCHLQGEARIPRYGRSYFDFRPGQRLEETLVVFLAGTGVADGKTEAVRHVQQMMASRCFTASEGKFGCTSCHDAHATVAKEDAPRFYRERCLTCHADGDCHAPQTDRATNGDSCFACHMPRLPSSDIAHTAQTDHRVLARAAAAAAATSGEASVKLQFFDGAEQRLPPWEAQRASGLAIVKQVLEQGQAPQFARIEALLAPGLAIAPDDTRVMTALVEVALRQNDLAAAEKYARMALEVEPQNEAALVALTLVCYQSNRIAEGLEFADRVLAINPLLDKIHAHRADMLRLSGRLPEGIEAAHKSLALNPRLLTVREWLVHAYRDQGQTIKAAEQKTILERMELAPIVKEPAVEKPSQESPANPTD